MKKAIVFLTMILLLWPCILSADEIKLLEKDIENPSKAKARKAGWFVRKYRSPANRAAPDDLFIKSSRIFFVEFKAPGKEATELQAIEHEKMRKAGATVYVCDTRELFTKILEREEINALLTLELKDGGWL